MPVIYAPVLAVMAAAVERGLIAALDPTEIAVVEVGRLVLGPFGAVALLAGGLLATASGANASILASSRITFAMGRDRLVTPSPNEVHPRFGTPYRAIAIAGTLVLVFIVAPPIEPLATLGSVLHLVIYGLLDVGLVVFREADDGEYEPSFEVPFSPVTPVLGAVVSFAFIAFIGPEVVVLRVASVIGAVAWYLSYARRRATEAGLLSRYILSRRERLPGVAVDAAEGVQPDVGEFRVMVPLSHPDHVTDLMVIGAAMALQRGGTIDAVHIVTVPDQTSLEYAAEHLECYEANYHAVLDRAREDAERLGVDLETHSTVSHRSFEEVFDAARTHDADLVVMGWGPSHGSPGRVESAVDDLATDLPGDFLVLRDRGIDPERVLPPPAGGPDSDLSAEVAMVLRAEFDAEVTLVHVAADVAAGEAFLEEWAAGHGLEDAALRVETGDVQPATERAAEDATLGIIGAIERGPLSRLVRGSLVLDVVDEIECSVLLAARARSRGLFQRLFGN